MSRRTIAAFERGRHTLSANELEAVASACGVEGSELVPAGHFLELVHAGPAPAAQPHPGPPLDTLLREYLLMVVELRGASDDLPATLRYDDMRELAKALGGTPDAIEAKIMDLLVTDRTQASEITRSILLRS